MNITRYCFSPSRLLCFDFQWNTNCLPRFPDPSLEERGRETSEQQQTQNLSLPRAKQESACKSVSWKCLDVSATHLRSPFVFLLVCFFSSSGLINHMCGDWGWFSVSLSDSLHSATSAVQWFYFSACWSLSLAKAAVWGTCSALVACQVAATFPGKPWGMRKCHGLLGTEVWV